MVEIEEKKLRGLVKTIVQSIGRTEQTLMNYDEKEALAIGQQVSIIHDGMDVLKSCAENPEIKQMAKEEFESLGDDTKEVVKEVCSPNGKEDQSYIS